VTDDEFLAMVVGACRALPRAESVSLGGSRARGDHRPDSDWDFAVYYRGDIDVTHFEQLGWPGHVFRPFEWGQVMYGGAVFDVDGRHLDLHYRNLDVVEHWTKEAAEGRFEVYQLGFHLAGIPTYTLPGELAINRVLWGQVERPEYPRALREHAPEFWLGRARRELGYASYWVQTENTVSCAGALAKIVLQAAHARLAHRGIWALNEKRMVEWAGLSSLNARFGALGSSRGELDLALQEVESAVADVESEVDAGRN
jgi:predicted nucleotidyltransferase